MLGLGRASQYAGWWAGGNPSVTFSATSALGYSNRQTPSYSLLCNTQSLPYSTLSTGEIDLTGYSSLTGFNNGKLTTVNTFRPEWPDPIESTTDFVAANFFNELGQGGTAYFLNVTLGLYNNNTQVYIQSPGAFTNTGLAVSVVRDRWITLVTSISNSQSDYVNWTGTQTSGTAYIRQCLFDAVTGELIYRADIRNNTTLPTVSSMPDTIPTNQIGDDYLFSGGFGSGLAETILYEFRWSNHWISVGTMFDPLGTAAMADTSWRTTKPSATIGTAKAWFNIQTTEFEYIPGSPENHYVTASGMDLYSEPNDRVVKDGGYGGSQWGDAYSDTIITTDQG
jgi:hypothetical protein